MVLKKNSVVLGLLFIFIQGFSQQVDPLVTTDSEQQKVWVDSIYNSLSLQEKIGQLFMIRAFSDKGKAHIDDVKKLV